MKPMLNFENGRVTIELSPFQCADIAAACHFASEYSFDEKIDVWRTLAALFRACTVAGYAHGHLSDPDLEAVLHQLDLLNFGKNMQESRTYCSQDITTNCRD